LAIRDHCQVCNTLPLRKNQESSVEDQVKPSLPSSLKPSSLHHILDINFRTKQGDLWCGIYFGYQLQDLTRWLWCESRGKTRSKRSISHKVFHPISRKKVSLGFKTR